MMGLYTYGVFITMSVVIAHHMQVAINTRNWGTYLTFWAIFSICMLPFTLWLAQIVPKSNTLKSTYRTILRNPSIWLMVFASSFVIVLPLYQIGIELITSSKLIVSEVHNPTVLRAYI